MLVGVPHEVVAATDAVSFTRVDIPMPAAPESVALGDLDGQHGKDIVVALPASDGVGVLLNNGNGTFAQMQPYSGGPQCAGVAVDITLGDVTTPAPGDRQQPDGKLDAYIACTPYVVRLTGDGTGALTNPESFNLGITQPLGSTTADMLALMHRQDSTPTTPPLLVFLQQANPGPRLCINYELPPVQPVCDATPVQGPLAVGDLNGTVAGVPPDEVVTSEGGALMGIFGFAPVLPLQWGDSTRSVPGNPPGLESAAMGDLDNDGDLDVLVGQYVNSLANRVDSIHYFHWDPAGAGGLEQIPHTLPSTAGLDAVAVADVDADGCNDVIGAGAFGRGLVHLGNSAGGFDGGQNLEQIGFGNPATATRVTMAVGDLSGDGRPEIVIADQIAHAVMVYANTSTSAGAACTSPPPPPPPPPPTGPPPAQPRARSRTPSGLPEMTCSWARPAATCSAAAAGTTACSGAATTTG